MRSDFSEIQTDFKSIQATLQIIAGKIEENLKEILVNTNHIDRVACRVKTEQSFLSKVSKEVNGIPKYTQPLKEIQDLIGARIVCYYKSDVSSIEESVKNYFQFVEINKFIPDDVRMFGYEGVHFVCFIPSTIFSEHKTNALIPDFFELQIKTLYQHAWSQAEHGLGYKPSSPLTPDEQRKLAFIAAQSWGADRLLEELATIKKK